VLDLMFVLGTRPEFIKLYPVMRQAVDRGRSICLVETGQHTHMLRPLYDDLQLHPDVSLTVDRVDGSLSEILSQSVASLEGVIAKTPTRIVVVHGDTSATLAGAMVGFYHRLPVAHVEAGLRTHDKYSPFPEEMNRTLVAQLADYHFAPTALAEQNLVREGVDPARVWNVGNTAIDTLAYTVDSRRRLALDDEIAGRRVVLVTMHRRENLGELAGLFAAINSLAEEFKHDSVVVFPIHLNPAIRRIAAQELTSSTVVLCEPLETVEFHNLMARSHLILTDSGGIQEEAPSLDTPVLVVRESTERPEGVESGALKVVGTDSNALLREARILMNDPEEHGRMAAARNPYGDGRAASRILDVLERVIA
jgi:UDP-N-acetylglucosamine 2-epimerase (non-hydrolysing)